MENPRLPARSHRICPQEPDGPPAGAPRGSTAEDGGGHEADALIKVDEATGNPFNKARI